MYSKRDTAFRTLIFAARRRFETTAVQTREVYRAILRPTQREVELGTRVTDINSLAEFCQKFL